MNTVGERLKTLREGMKFSQKKMAELLNVTQPSINRYEHGQSVPSIELLIKYADYFDVSMDYITCRCDEPQGKLYQVKPPVYYKGNSCLLSIPDGQIFLQGIQVGNQNAGFRFVQKEILL